MLGRDSLWDLIRASSKSKIDYAVRFLESETAYQLNMELDTWYQLPRVTRENLIATRLARGWVDMISTEAAYARKS